MGRHKKVKLKPEDDGTPKEPVRVLVERYLAGRRNIRDLPKRIEAGTGWTPLQLLILIMVKETPGCTQYDLIEPLASDRSTINQSVHLLVEKGVLATTVAEENQRKRKLTLTDQGKRAYERVASKFNDLA